MPSLKHSLILLSIIAFGASLWLFSRPQTHTLTDLLQPYEQAGTHTKEDLSRIASLPIHEEDGVFRMEDDGKQGIQIAYANAAETPPEAKEPDLSLSFPKESGQPIEIRLDQERIITIEDTKNRDLKPELLSDISATPIHRLTDEESPSLWQRFLDQLGMTQKDDTKSYLSYSNQRKTILYTLKKDQATDEKQLKSWTLYQSGNGIEQEAYRIDHTRAKINADGHVELFYQGDQELKNEQAKGEVEPSLLERAQRTLEKEMGEDILNGNQTPDLIIPKPFFYDQDGERHESEWAWDQESKTLSLELTFRDDLYPIALDPTLQFTAPAQSNTGDVITGEASSAFGTSMVTGDFNADGKADLAVGAASYSTGTGRVYLFYQDGKMAVNAGGADVVITGEATTSFLGESLASGDFNADGKTDLAVGGSGYSSDTGRAYIFYNDGSIPTTAATADVIITGEATYDGFGISLTAGDLNADGKTDLVVGAYGYSGGAGTGRAYIFYNDGSIPTTAATADVIITGEATSDSFSISLTAGDLNADGKTDLVVGAYGYSGGAGTGRAYIFYNDGSIPTTAATADVIITGEATSNGFGYVLASGDLNADGKTDLAVGANSYSSNTGRAYLFYNDGSIPTTAATADVIITGEATGDGFGISMTVGDLNADGKTDLAVGANSYSSNTGRAYLFYNDGSIPTTAATADVIITGEATNNGFGISMTTGDLNADGRTDLFIGANYFTDTSRAYIFYSQNGQVNTNKGIVGGAANDAFGWALAFGDWNADGKADLAVGSAEYASNLGKISLFYNDGVYPDTSATADVTIAGTIAGGKFGGTLLGNDMNNDGKMDLVVGTAAPGTGKIYVFYNDGSYPTDASGADSAIDPAYQFGGWLDKADMNNDGRLDLLVSSSDALKVFYNDGSLPTTPASADMTITGSGTFGGPTAVGDFNADGKQDIAVGAIAMAPPTTAGYAYIFYNDGSWPTTAATADVTIIGDAYSNFGSSLSAGDFNADGKTDLMIGAYNADKTYLFYNDGSYPAAAASADVVFTGSNYFGFATTAGDFNADGRTDIAVGAWWGANDYVSIFYNDGSYPTTSATADVTIRLEEASSYFSLTSGDWNADGRTDLVIGSRYYSSNTGRVLLYETRENFAWKLQPVPLTTPFRTQTGSGAGEELSITGEASSGLGSSLVTGDFNADGKTDLAVGAQEYAGNSGRVYLFYNDGSLSASVASADAVITGTTSYYFGHALESADLNSDGRTDLIVGTYSLDMYVNRAYVFYNDGSYPATYASADIVLTGESASGFGYSLAVGDWNADGKTDLAVGADLYSSQTGRAYLFYNDGSIPTTAATADVIITGNATSDAFGYSLAAGDWNADGKTDLAVGAVSYSSVTGRAYLFYNDGSIPTTAATADVIITGNATWNYFGNAFAAVDCNADGKNDLVVGAKGAGVYIFYNDGSYPSGAASADISISGGGEYFGSSITLVDVNADGRKDLTFGSYSYSSNTGRTHIFYNDGSIPTTAATADIILTGEATSNRFGGALTAGDLNGDGKTDLVVSATGYSSSKGRVYLYTWNDAKITGEAAGSYFGISMASGDWNSDGKTDLAVGANGYSSFTGRTYIFYQDGSYPALAAAADVIITGETTNNYFGSSLVSGDWNADGKTDLAVGAFYYSSLTGRAYIFYNDGSIPTTAASADIIITGEVGSQFSWALASGDLNSDGKIDLIAGAVGNSKTYIFYNDGSIPTTAATADVIITGSGTTNFGRSLVTGDLNTDGKTDLVVSAALGSYGYAYIFYNDGSIPTTSATADVGLYNPNSASFGTGMVIGDWNADGRADIAAGSPSFNGSRGVAHIFYNDGSMPVSANDADVTILNYYNNSSFFGNTMAAGDMNADGKTDLIVSAYSDASSRGQVFVFYNDGSYPSDALTADVIEDGETTNGYFGVVLATGDFNTDSITDLAVGSRLYNGDTGRAYIITTEAKVEPQAGVRARGTTKIRGSFLMKR